MKTRLINKCQAENIEPKVTNIIDNEVHPLNWAMSPGPSPMGTNPINLLKWYKMVLETTSATVKQNAGQKVFKTPL